MSLKAKREKFHGEIAFAELVAYIDENRSQDTVTVFKLAELSDLHQERLQQLGVNIRSHPTRLKNRLTTHYPDMKAFTKGHNVLLSFEADVGNVLHNMHKDFANLTETARVIRKEMFSMPANFDGSFNKGFQENSISKTLRELISMIMFGLSITTQSESTLYIVHHLKEVPLRLRCKQLMSVLSQRCHNNHLIYLKLLKVNILTVFNEYNLVITLLHCQSLSPYSPQLTSEG